MIVGIILGQPHVKVEHMWYVLVMYPMDLHTYIAVAVHSTACSFP